MYMKFILVLALALSGCVSGEKKQASFDENLQLGRCDEAVVNLPQNDPMVKMVRHSEHAGKSVLSYAFVGASYTAEVLWDVAGGTVMFVALCGPLLAASVAGNAAVYYPDGGQAVSCLPGKLSALGAPPLGRQAVKATREMRCPEVATLSRSLRAVASCYESRGGEENLRKAEAQLQSIRKSAQLLSCLPKEEYELFAKQEAALAAKKK